MNFIVYDLEATCWMGKPPKGIQEIIEIGAFKINHFGEAISSFSSFIQPVANPKLSPFCQKLTSITQSDVDGARKFPQVIQQFQDWIDIYDEEYLLCSWGKFDIDLLRNDCNLHRIETGWLDYHTNLKSQYHEFKKMVKYTGLKNTVDREGFEFTGVQHRAISDAENLAKIFIKYIDEWIY
ncbi:MAG TPA: 3'-5' exonuclease [Saprospiraceae bacterium]|nr:3'-5' exonuclease [Saprospiraceae bacterium]